MPDDSRLFLFEFRGRAEIRTQERPEESEAVRILNDQSDLIEQEIQQEIRRALPVGVNVEAQIRFYEGSIAWEGIVVVLDWMARLAGAAEFVSILSLIVRVAVKRVLQRWLSRKLSFPIRVISPIQVEVTFQTTGGYSGQSASSRQSQSPATPRILVLLTAINTMLLLIVLIVQIVIR